jgi:hypothetical protein
MAIVGVSLARNADTAQRVVIQFSCDASTAVGNPVYQSSIDDQTVIPVTTNSSVSQVIGVCIEKINATTARILILGIASGYTGLTKGGRIFLSTTGTLSNTRPLTGYIHNLGVAISATEILFVPNNIRVLQA